MALISVICPRCQNNEPVVKNGKSAEGKQQFLCRSQSWHGRTFMYPDKSTEWYAEKVIYDLQRDRGKI